MRMMATLAFAIGVLISSGANAKGRCKPQKRHRRLDLVQLREETGLRVLRPKRAWGNRLLVNGVRQVAAAHHRQFPNAPPLWVHDISREGGGRISRHCSHRAGQDVDIRLPLRAPAAGYVNATPRTLDVERLWFLVMSLTATCDVEMIFFDRELQQALYDYGRRHQIWRRHLKWLLQYPFRRASGVVRHRDHHKNHMHVRFRRPGTRLDLHGATKLCALEETGSPLVHRLLHEHTRRLGAAGGYTGGR